MEKTCDLYRVVMTISSKGYIDIDTVSDKEKKDNIKCAKLICRATLGKGIHNALHIRDLSLIWGVDSPKVKDIVQLARHHGERILSDTHGYWYAENTDEVKRFIASMEKQALTRKLTIECILNAPTE